MTKLIVFISIICQCLIGHSQDILVHTGTYRGKNIYVQNPFASNGVGFSVKEVKVNGEAITFDYCSSAFEIDLEKQGFKQGDSLSIHILHEENSMPKFLNPEALRLHSRSIVDKIWVEDENQLRWCVKGANQEVDFIIEQYRTFKWVKAGEVKGSRFSTDTCYKFLLTNYSDSNFIRIKYLNHHKSDFMVSETLVFDSKLEPVEFLDYKYKSKTIILSQATLYEVYDYNGNLFKKGFHNEIDLSPFIDGVYYIFFDSFKEFSFEKH